MRAGGCGLPELDLEGEERVEEVGADEVGDEAVAAGGDPLSPKGRVGLGSDGVERAAVPEAAVDEGDEAVRTGVPEGASVSTEIPVIQLATVSPR